MKVIRASLKEGALIQGVLTAETTLVPNKIAGLEMYYEPEGLFVKAKGQWCIVPRENVRCVFLDKKDAEAIINDRYDKAEVKKIGRPAKEANIVA